MYDVVPDGTGDALDVRATSVLRAPYSALVELLGRPHGMRHHVAVWQLGRDGVPLIRVRDGLKRADPDALDGFSRRPWYDWVVEAVDDRHLRRGCRWLSAQVITWAEARPRARQLDPRAREALNQLLARGVSLDDALRQVERWDDIPLTDRYAWPVASTR